MGRTFLLLSDGTRDAFLIGTRRRGLGGIGYEMRVIIGKWRRVVGRVWVPVTMVKLGNTALEWKERLVAG